MLEDLRDLVGAAHRLWRQGCDISHFGSKDYNIRAFPVSTNQYPQSKMFRTGGWFSEEGQIPKRIYFDMEQQGNGFSIDLKPHY